MSTLPIIFSNEKDLDDFAYKFLVEYILESLENDVTLCLSLPYANTKSPTNAYIPALFYCFSVIDLLGSLLAGNARSGSTTTNSKNYMTKYIGYKEEKVILLQKMYRHKIVHLAMPKIAVLYQKKLLSWKLHDTNSRKHLTIDWKDINDIPLFGYGNIHCDGKYILNIKKFKNDIKKSITKRSGYLQHLKNNTDLRYKFVNAINQIYDPIIVD